MFCKNKDDLIMNLTIIFGVIIALLINSHNEYLCMVGYYLFLFTAFPALVVLIAMCVLVALGFVFETFFYLFKLLKGETGDQLH